MSRLVIALMVVWTVQVLANVYAGGVETYWHLGRKAATIIAPETPSCLPLKSASIMTVFMVTAWLSPKVIVSNALMAGMDGAQQKQYGRCRY